jgi:hypothetical protein
MLHAPRRPRWGARSGVLLQSRDTALVNHLRYSRQLWHCLPEAVPQLVPLVLFDGGMDCLQIIVIAVLHELARISGDDACNDCRQQRRWDEEK